jgi:hypothetical protein
MAPFTILSTYVRVIVTMDHPKEFEVPERLPPLGPMPESASDYDHGLEDVVSRRVRGAIELLVVYEGEE